MSRNVGLTGWCNGGSPFLNGDLLTLRAWIILTSIFFFIELYEEKDIDYPCTRNLQLAILVRIAVVSRSLLDFCTLRDLCDFRELRDSITE